MNLSPMTPHYASTAAANASDEFDIGVADGYGFLVEVRDGNVNLHPALYDGSSGPIPSIDLQAHCSVMDEKMKAFAQRFIG